MRQQGLKLLISHAWEDKDIARRLENLLTRAGVEVWVDHSKVRGGDIIASKVSEALEWCNTVLLLWSDHAKESKWVEREWSCAINLERKIIPCNLDSTKIPAILINVAHLSFSSIDQGVEMLFQTLDINMPFTKAKVASAEKSTIEDKRKKTRSEKNTQAEKTGLKRKNDSESDLSDALRKFMSEGFGFGDIFSKSTDNDKKIPGTDLLMKLKLTPIEISEGVIKKLKLKYLMTCDVCSGGSVTKECPKCHGTGEVREVSQSLFGQFVNIIKCSKCNGVGKTPMLNCTACNGERRIKKTKIIAVTIPPNSKVGDKLKLLGQGNAGLQGCSNGDLILELQKNIAI